jgi:two-component system response regulator HydG
MSATALKLPHDHETEIPLTLGRPRVLVADDDRDMCELTEVGLRQRAYDVAWRLTPEEALAELDRGDYSALVVDIDMDGKSGLDLCRDAIAKRPDLPVIVMTGFGTVDHAIGAIRAGAYDFITKPVSMEALQLTLDRAIQHRSMA